jgi:hypothetical protein
MFKMLASLINLNSNINLLSQTNNSEVLVNIILVKDDVRPAYLLQFANYDEYNNKGIITSSLANEAKHLFPEFILSTDYSVNQGIIISKKNYNGRNDIDLDKMGEILGYNDYCKKKFTLIDRDIDNYYIEFYYKIRGEERNNLFTVVCDKVELEEIITCNNFVIKAKKALQDEKNKKYLFGLLVEDISYEIKNDISPQTIFNKLLNNKDLSDEDLMELDNMLFYNFYMIEDDDISNKFKKLLQKNNPAHHGILLTLLNFYINDILQTFYPLTNYPTNFEEIKQTLNKHYKQTITILEKTSIKNGIYYYN